MNKFRQHIPGFIDVNKRPEWIEFETTQDLLSLDIVKRWEKKTDTPFSYFAMSDNYLMAVLDDGFSWWVIGRIEKPGEIDLPKWDGGKHMALMPDGEIKVLLGSEVMSSCGDVLTLNDGTEAKSIKRA